MALQSACRACYQKPWPTKNKIDPAPDPAATVRRADARL
jgi:hypothetical protein